MQKSINTVSKGQNNARPLFIPMPKGPGMDAIDHCFFLPMMSEMVSDNAPSVSYELFLLVDETNCLGFRYEPKDSVGSHDYGHVQMNRRMLRKTLQSATPQWIPDSYPAFPLGTSDPLEMFLSLATSVHGNTDGFKKIVMEIFQAESRTAAIDPYLLKLEKLLL